MADGLVVPFYRGPLRLGPEGRALFARRLGDDAFAAALARAPAAVRVNVARVLAAAALAAAEHRPLALVEGWHANVVERPRRGVRIVTGSWVGALLLRLLAARGLVPARLPVRRVNRSRCTLEEVRAAAELRPGGELVAVAGVACPSARRVGRLLAAVQPATVLTPAAALARAGAGDRAAAVLRAAALRPVELVAACALEAAAWGTHLLSVVEARLVGAEPPLEQRLAHRVRPDLPRRAPIFRG